MTSPAPGRLAISVTISSVRQLLTTTGSHPLAPLIEAARVADDAGIDQLALPDHLAIGPRTDRYPYGRFPYPPDEPWLEPLTALATLAGATRRVRLATGILIAPLRPALLLAKSAATLDVLSGGRLDLGVGTGWQREEFEASGFAFAGRTRRLDDTLRACRALWTDAPARFHSDTVSFDELWCLPRPLQPGGPPIWIGGAASDGNRARLVEYAAGWMPIVSRDRELADGLAVIREDLARAGRDPGELLVRATPRPVLDRDGRVDLERTLETLPALARAGATHASFPLGLYARGPEEVRPVLERLGRWARTGA